MYNTGGRILIDKRKIEKVNSITRYYSSIGLLTAIAVLSNYSLIWIPNVKIMDLIVFISGFYYGILAGIIVGILSWMVYGSLNPYGFVLQIWLATMLCETFYGIIGGLLKNKDNIFIEENYKFRKSILLGFIGFLITLLYDVLTNLAFAYIFNLPFIYVMIFGIPFTISHEISNFILFSIGLIPIIKIIKKIGGDKNVFIKK